MGENFSKTDMWRFWKCDRKRERSANIWHLGMEILEWTTEKIQLFEVYVRPFSNSILTEIYWIFFLAGLCLTPANVVLDEKVLHCTRVTILLPLNCRFVNILLLHFKNIFFECNPKYIRFELIIVLWYRRHLNKTIALCQSFRTILVNFCINPLYLFFHRKKNKYLECMLA